MYRDLAWGRYFDYAHRHRSYDWRHLPIPELVENESILPHGMGRSYGDSCLNQGQTLIETRSLNRFIAFDARTGLLRCEAGVTLEDIIKLALPKGWFLPVTPGSKFVTIGGAIANDVHGKNHHLRGSFGRHVPRFELLRSDGERKLCSPSENSEFYRATIGGLGLTGLITWAELQLMPVNNAFLSIEEIRYANLDEFLALNDASQDWEYTVAWVDCLAKGDQLGRGIFIRANHAPQAVLGDLPRTPKAGKKTVPFAFPNIALNTFSINAFNQLYLRKNGWQQRTQSIGHYDAFFYPLDAIHHWNRIYGNRGFLQYQFAVPRDNGDRAIHHLMQSIANSGYGSFLTVLKAFGDIESPGLLSFPTPGITFALDFPNKGQATLDLLSRLDEYVMEVGGRVYPAKDARMSSQAFQQFYPQWSAFSDYIDPKFNSSFWTRVTQPTDQ